MRKRVLSAVAVAMGLTLCGASASAQSGDVQLVVAISVDQLRADLLDRYASAFTGGIRRFLDAGHRFTEASHAHAFTETAAGHATLSTGVFPARSGIVANEWRQRVGEIWEPMYAVQDNDSPLLDLEGYVSLESFDGRSPRNLLRPGLADWVLAADPDSRAVSLSGKDRAAITMAGQAQEAHVYWVVPEVARFATSRFYRDKYPGWVRDFNEEVMPGIYADSVWDTSVPEDLRGLARPDSADYEGDGVHTVFPHLAAQELSDSADAVDFNLWASYQEREDEAVLALAREAVDEFRLGQRDHVDFLALALSATDHVGHDYGPLSLEQLDNLLHLDRELGRFLEYLDETVGDGNWVAGFSADHGVQTIPEYRATQGVDAKRLLIADLQQPLSAAVQEAAQANGSAGDLAERIARAVEKTGIVARAYTHRELTTGMPADSFATFFRNSYYPGRAGGWLSRFGVELRFPENHLVDDEPTGTTHGSPYWYDRAVPFILLGAGVEPGTSAESVYTVDFAPTLAGLAGIPTPPDLDGRSVYR